MKNIDGLTNVVSGLGTEKSKREHNKFQADILGQTPELEAAYLSDWLAAKIVNTPADDSTREWRRFKCKDAEELSQAEKLYGVQSLVREARTWARLYGGAGIIPIIRNMSLEKPLDVTRIKRGSLERFMVFDRTDLIPGIMNTTDILKANYNLPETYSIRGGSAQIHWTWVARFNGLLLPKRYMTQTLGWGDSSLRKCLSAIADLVASVGGIAELMQEANIDVITREGLTDELASDEDDAITKRYALFSQMKSIVNMALLDGNEALTRNTLNLGGVSPIIEQFMTWISGAAEQPVTKLFGTSAKGMNATGEGDESNYYDMVRSQQTNDIEPGLKLIDEVLVRSTFGDWVDDFDYEWNPLKQQNASEIATARHLDAQRHDMLLQAGVIERGQVMQELQANELYQFEEGQIEDALEFDSVIDPSEYITSGETDEGVADA
jgi:uncharacterized protein